MTRSEARFRAIYENAPCMINSFQPDGKLVLWNRCCEELIGYTMDEVNAAPDALALFYPDPEARRQALEGITRNDGKFREFKVRRKDGRYVYQMWANFSLEDGSAISVGYDVTETREAREQLRQMNQTLEEKVAARTRELDEQRAKLFFASRFVALAEMAGGVAHEINNPLAIISGYTTQISEILKQSEPDRRALEDMLGSIRGAVSRITKIISGLRNISRDGSRDPVTVCRLADIVSDALGLCRERFSSNGVELGLNFELADATVRGRPVELAQVLLNLLNNAFDAVEPLAERRVKLRVYGESSQVCLSVTDNGPGIPDSLRDKLFQPFFTTKAVGKGMGLGLSISRSILEAHGGSLAAETDRGQTCFVARLPRA